MIKGKILFLVTLLVALVLTAASALVGYVAATELAVVFEQSLLAFDWDTIKIICAAICGGLMLIITLPTVITARQVCRMYNVSRKYGKWSVSSSLFGLLLAAITGGSIAYVVYMLSKIPQPMVLLLQNKLLEATGISIDLLTVQVACGVVIFAFFLLLFLPLLVAVRGRDGVSALLKKKRTYSEDEE